MTASEVRHLLADTAASVLPDEWTSYPGPPELCQFPSAVVVPRSPWVAPATACDGVYMASVTLLVPRSMGVAMLDVLDQWATPVRKALTALGGIVWEGTDLGPMLAPGGIDAYGAAINLQVYP